MDVAIFVAALVGYSPGESGAENEALLVFPDRTEAFANASKQDLAMHLVRLVESDSSSQSLALL